MNGAIFIIKKEENKYIGPVDIHMQFGKLHKQYELDISHCPTSRVMDFIKEDVEITFGSLVRKEFHWCEECLYAFENYQLEKIEAARNEKDDDYDVLR